MNPLRDRDFRRPGRILWAAIRSYFRNNTLDQAAALAFISLVSLVPMATAFSFLLSALFGGDEELAGAVARTLPFASQEVVATVTGIVRQARSVSAIGIAIFFFLAYRAYARVEYGINRIWHIQAPRRFRTSLGSFLVMMFFGPVLLGTFANLRLAVSARVPWLVESPLRLAGGWITFAVTAAAFTMIHWKGPNTRVRLLPAINGGIAAAGGLLAIRWMLARPWPFIRQTNVVYGSVAVFELFLTSLFVFWAWFFFTVELTHAWQRSTRNLWAYKGGKLPPPEEDGALAVRIARGIGEVSSTGGAPRTAEQWSDELAVPADDAERVIRRLEATGLVLIDREDRVIPARDPRELRLLQAWNAAAVRREMFGPAADELGETARLRDDLLSRRSWAGTDVRDADAD